MARQRDDGISQGLSGWRLHRREPGHSVRECHHVGCGAMTFGCPNIQPRIVAVPQRLGQSFGQRNAVLNSSIHALPAGRTMDMRRVSTEQNATPPRILCDPVMNVKSRTPNYGVNTRRIC
jgi:hypothetical protein